MQTVDLIIKKKNGSEFNEQEITYLINSYVAGDIPDYQMSGLLMAICFRGMSASEQYFFTKAMLLTGEQIDLSGLGGIKVDKHSTGGVGDKTTLVVGPILAACGLKFAKMSGRGLGHTGGTLDKLEAIPGFRINISSEEFFRQVTNISIAVIGQTAEIAVADKKLYALRDVTGTVDSVGLIASSIMSKKLASGADYILLDVKVGSGAFMKDIGEARVLARSMVDIGKAFGKTTTAVLTNMNEPLGEAVGNALEVIEAVEMLKGRGPDDFKTLCYELSSTLLVMTKLAKTYGEARNMVKKCVESGAALEKFQDLVRYQGGNAAVVHDYRLLPMAKYQINVESADEGYISCVDALAVGHAAMELGAGRKTKDDIIDPAVGLIIKGKVGCHIRAGDALAVIHANREINTGFINEVRKAFVIKKEEVDFENIILDTIF